MLANTPKANAHFRVPVESAVNPDIRGETELPNEAPVAINPKAAGANLTGTKSPADAAQIT